MHGISKAMKTSFMELFEIIDFGGITQTLALTQYALSQYAVESDIQSVHSPPQAEKVTKTKQHLIQTNKESGTRD